MFLYLNAASAKPVLEHMSLEEKIGQLFIVPACELRGEDHFDDILRIIKECHVGGFLFKQGTAQGQVDLIEKLKLASDMPPLMVQDGEWGVGMRLNDVISFPKNLTLGAIQDLELLYQLGQEIGSQCRLVGAHLNLAPVVDVNSNPGNPIIHTRSFGEDPLEVAKRGEKVMQGIQSMGVLACAKHFPGHGDTSVDSHVDLPTINCSRERMQRVELLPFEWMIRSGIQAVMTAHIDVPAYAEIKSYPATFSPRIVSQLLQTELGFDGLVITDALNMKALSKSYSAGDIALYAFLAGHDLLLYGDHIAPNVDEILRAEVPQAFLAIKEAVRNGVISEEMIDQRVKKVLEIKEALGLFNEVAQIRVGNVRNRINTPEAFALKKRLFDEAATLVYDIGILPLPSEKIAFVEWGDGGVLSERLKAEHDVDVYSLSDPDLFGQLQRYSKIVLCLSKYRSFARDFGMNREEEGLIRSLVELKVPVVTIVFGTPYSLAMLPTFSALLICYENEKEAQEAAAEVLLGHLSPHGRLPVSLPSSALGLDQINGRGTTPFVSQ